MVITNANPGGFDTGTGYDISIHRTDAGDLGTLKGYILSSVDYSVIPGTRVTVTLNAKTDGTDVLSTGYYSMDIPSGTWPIVAAAPGGFSTPPGVNVTVQANNETSWVEYMSQGAEPGDIDGDGIVDQTDADIVMAVLTGETPATPVRDNYPGSGADVNRDGLIGPEELIYILGKIP
ncbi:unnamed protein product, partial [marine sediment metagenome]